jgi:hypothetical protein
MLCPYAACFGTQIGASAELINDSRWVYPMKEFSALPDPRYKDAHTLNMLRCHHGMARPRVADRGDGLQIWRVAANMLNKQSRTADKGWSSSLEVGRGADNPHRKKIKLL